MKSYEIVSRKKNWIFWSWCLLKSISFSSIKQALKQVLPVTPPLLYVCRFFKIRILTTTPISVLNLVSNKVSAIVGPFRSSHATIASYILTELRIPMITPTSTGTYIKVKKLSQIRTIHRHLLPLFIFHENLKWSINLTFPFLQTPSWGTLCGLLISYTCSL